tara:strand:+ start:71 stop:331 length:261 start_codon:yes stop_codon:yes gene_type:complete
MTKTVIIKDSEMDAVRTEIVAIAMMHFGIKQYRIQEGYSEATLYGLSWEICSKLEETGFVEEVAITGDMDKECVSDMVYNYIKNNK